MTVSVTVSLSPQLSFAFSGIGLETHVVCGYPVAAKQPLGLQTLKPAGPGVPQRSSLVLLVFPQKSCKETSLTS